MKPGHSTRPNFGRDNFWHENRERSAADRVGVCIESHECGWVFESARRDSFHGRQRAETPVAGQTISPDLLE